MKKGSLESLELPKLKIQNKKAETNIKKNQEKIDRNLSNFQGINLPKRVLKQYEKEFKKQHSIFAFKVLYFNFALAFLGITLVYFSTSI